MYAEIIISSSVDRLDRPFTYRIPEDFPIPVNEIIGREVLIPFGKSNREIKGFVIGLTDKIDFDESAAKDIIAPVNGSTGVEENLMEMAAWLRKNYGGTMNDAIHSVIPAPKKTESRILHTMSLAVSADKARALITDFEIHHKTARARLLKRLLEADGNAISFTNYSECGLTYQALKDIEANGFIKLSDGRISRDPDMVVKAANSADERDAGKVELNEEQQKAVDTFLNNHREGESHGFLLFGVTGSGKTEVYMKMMENVIASGKQVIFLIPEIALTFQMIDRLSRRFGGKISMLNSKMSQGERYDQYLKAKEGEISIIVGPRSALFTPFPKLGLIIVDEEHEESYKSEKTPRYQAREAAMHRAEREKADIVLGSATPSLEAIKMVSDKKLTMLSLTRRAGGAEFPHTDIIDLREELKAGNRSVISRRLAGLIEDRLKKHEQIMLFINRRGYAGFVNCRSCGTVLKCPHCDVSLTFHRPGRLVCHYCGYERQMPKICPTCGSKYIATFGLGTEKVEEAVKAAFSSARVLRMDGDTTAGKNGHEEILSIFRNGEADILIGTQMIVKGHDFPRVTLVGVLAADLSLFTNDYRAGERTFDLVLQAAGRAGRGKIPGNVVIQTYHPEHYAVIDAAERNYNDFYKQEMKMRFMGGFPPSGHMLAIITVGADPDTVTEKAKIISTMVEENIPAEHDIMMTGPVWATIAKLRDRYRKVVYIRAKEREVLVGLKDIIENKVLENKGFAKVSVQFDFDPEGTI